MKKREKATHRSIRVQQAKFQSLSPASQSQQERSISKGEEQGKKDLNNKNGKIRAEKESEKKDEDADSFMQEDYSSSSPLIPQEQSSSSSKVKTRSKKQVEKQRERMDKKSEEKQSLARRQNLRSMVKDLVTKVSKQPEIELQQERKSKSILKEKQKEKDRSKEKQKERQRQKQRQRQKEKQKQKQRQKEKERQKQRQRQRQREKQRKQEQNDGSDEGGDEKIKFNQNYKPKNFSQPFNILKALYLLQAHMRPTSIEKIQQKFLTFKDSQFRQWDKHIQRLIINNFIIAEDKQQTRIRLLEKGQRFITPKVKLVDRRKQNAVKKQLAKILANQGKKQSQINSQINDNKDKELGKAQGPGSKYVYFKQGNNSFVKYPKQVLSSSRNADKIRMIINQSADILKEDLQSFIEFINKDDSIKFQVESMPTNINFFWQVEGKIVDYFVILIQNTKTDLQTVKTAISDTKYCSSTNVALLVQEHKEKGQTKEEIKKSKKLTKFIADARAACIPVVKSKNIQQSILFLRKVTSLLAKKIRTISETGEPISHYGPLEKIHQWFKLSKIYNLRRITIKCLKKFKRFSVASLKRVAQKLPTFGCLYSKMVRLDTNEERLRFMNWLLQKYDSDIEANWSLVCVMFLTDYSKYVRKAEANDNQQQSEEDGDSQENEEESENQSEAKESLSSSSEKQENQQNSQEKEEEGDQENEVQKQIQSDEKSKQNLNHQRSILVKEQKQLGTSEKDNQCQLGTTIKQARNQEGEKKKHWKEYKNISQFEMEQECMMQS